MSPARAHQARVLASMGGRVMASSGTAPARPPVAANDGARPSAATPVAAEARAHQQLLGQLGVDERRLKAIQSIERKAAAKREMLPAYQAWVDGRLAGDVATADAIVSTVMVWSMDVGDWPRALDIADHVLRHGLPLPARFSRTPACAIAETVANAACEAHQRGQDFDHDALVRTAELTAEHDLPDEVRARLLKALGQQLAREADAGPADDAQRALRERALTKLRRARELDARAGVADLIKRLERAQAKEAAS